MKKISVLLFLAGVVLVVQSAVFSQQAQKAANQQTVVPKAFPASFTEPVTGMEFVLVKGGCYAMGDTFGDGAPASELPVHEVCVDDFYLGKYHVTNEQFKKFIDATRYRTTAEVQGTGLSMESGNPVKSTGDWYQGANWQHPQWPSDNIETKMNHPVVQVSWHDAKAFAQWLIEKTDKNFRLAYEAEYEYAIRNGGKRHKYAWGDGPISGNVPDVSLTKIITERKKGVLRDYDDGYAFTSPVGSFKPNELGLYDMTGNVFSWVEDWFNKEYYGSSPKNNPRGLAVQGDKIARGGSWSMNPWMLRASCRYDLPPDTRKHDIGFRLAMTAR